MQPCAQTHRAGLIGLAEKPNLAQPVVGFTDGSLRFGVQALINGRFDPLEKPVDWLDQPYMGML